MTTKHLVGGCLCGGVRYEVSGSPLYAGYCHCSQCRRFSGSAFSAFAGVRAEQLRIAHGEEHIGTYSKTGGTQLRFCTRCGSSLYALKVDHGLVHLRLGSLDGDIALRPQAHVHVASKAPWYDIPNDGLPRYAAAPEIAGMVASGGTQPCTAR